ncbi:MAG: CDP-alcohol phosphatidyltransferase family protein [Phycisphaerales bacterium]|nr:CDP-alcohol phosphatidyltransferase family protein [Phycisphaerales bacterium]
MMKVINDESSPMRSRPRVRRLRTVAVFPTLLTLGNLLCGFAAIYFCMRGLYFADIDPSIKATLNSKRLEEFLPTFISVGGFLIFVGMFFDMLDGRVARMTSGTTNFGGQLDSLADMVTFGLAPAFLMIGLVTMQFHRVGTLNGAVPDPGDLVFTSRGAWMAGAIFAACCALRLARYNVEHSQGGLKHSSFHGLPSPGAAAAVASLVILYEHVPEVQGALLVNLLPPAAVVTGLLMVSRVRYVHIGNRYLRGRRPLSFVVVLLVILGLLMRWPSPTIATLTCLYALTGPVAWLVGIAQGKKGNRRGGNADEHVDSDQPLPADGTNQ